MSLKAGLSGYVVIRNGIELDYPFLESIASLVPVCNEVVVCDNLSSDSTMIALRGLVEIFPKVRLISWPEPVPVGDRTWYDRWLNFTRRHLKYDMQISLDADEILDSAGADEIRTAVSRRECRWFKYVNFWTDAQHTVPWGDQRKAQLAPTECWMPSHAPVPVGEVDIRALATPHPSLTIYHYSLLRREAAFVAKQHFTMRALEGHRDEDVDLAVQCHRRYVECFPEKQISEFTGQHPAVIHEWLLAHGWKLR